MTKRRRSPVLTDGTTIDPTELPTGDDKRHAVRSMFDSIAPRYDLVNRVMTFGLDTRWRRRAVEDLGLPAGSVVVDLACGTGDFCRGLQRRGILPVGLDISMGMLVAARTTAPVVHADILSMPLPDASADGATCGFALRNLVELPGFFDELARVVRPGGRVALLDAAQPDNPILRFGHGIYFRRVVPMIGGLLSDRAAYRYLPKSLAYLPEWPVMAAQLQSSGFNDVKRRIFVGAQLITATRSQ